MSISMCKLQMDYLQCAQSCDQQNFLRGLDLHRVITKKYSCFLKVGYLGTYNK